MSEIASRDLRNNTRALLDRVEQGEEVVITVNGRPQAVLQPVPTRPTWMSRDEFARRIGAEQADPGLDEELRSLAPGHTDETPLP